MKGGEELLACRHIDRHHASVAPHGKTQAAEGSNEAAQVCQEQQQCAPSPCMLHISADQAATAYADRARELDGWLGLIMRFS